jgi:hypothetical protein
LEPEPIFKEGDEMEQFKSLVRAREKALGIFEKAKNRLEQVISDIDVELQFSKDRSDELAAELHAEHDAKVYLQSQRELTKKTVDDLQKFLG